jgi:hypothetical protein
MWMRERVVAERTLVPKAKTSPLNPHRHLPVVSLGAAAVRCRRHALCLSFLGAGFRAEQLFFLQGLTHMVAAGPSAPQRRHELRPAPRCRARGGRPCRAAGCSPCVGAVVCCARLLGLTAT